MSVLDSFLLFFPKIIMEEEIRPNGNWRRGISHYQTILSIVVFLSIDMSKN